MYWAENSSVHSLVLSQKMHNYRFLPLNFYIDKKINLLFYHPFLMIYHHQKMREVPQLRSIISFVPTVTHKNRRNRRENIYNSFDMVIMSAIYKMLVKWMHRNNRDNRLISHTFFIFNVGHRIFKMAPHAAKLKVIYVHL